MDKSEINNIANMYADEMIEDLGNNDPQKPVERQILVDDITQCLNWLNKKYLLADKARILRAYNSAMFMKKNSKGKPEKMMNPYYSDAISKMMTLEDAFGVETFKNIDA